MPLNLFYTLNNLNAISTLMSRNKLGEAMFETFNTIVPEIDLKSKSPFIIYLANVLDEKDLNEEELNLQIYFLECFVYLYRDAKNFDSPSNKISQEIFKKYFGDINSEKYYPPDEILKLEGQLSNLKIFYLTSLEALPKLNEESISYFAKLKIDELLITLNNLSKDRKFFFPNSKASNKEIVTDKNDKNIQFVVEPKVDLTSVFFLNLMTNWEKKKTSSPAIYLSLVSYLQDYATAIKNVKPNSIIAQQITKGILEQDRYAQTTKLFETLEYKAEPHEKITLKEYVNESLPEIKNKSNAPK